MQSTDIQAEAQFVGICILVDVLYWCLYQHIFTYICCSLTLQWIYKGVSFLSIEQEEELKSQMKQSPFNLARYEQWSNYVV